MFNSKQFDADHKYNMETLELFKTALYAAWIKDGKPKEKPGELGKHVWITIAGAVDRCFQAIKEEDKIYMDILRKRMLED